MNMNTPVKTLVTEAVLVDRNLQLLTDRLQGLKRQIILAAAASRETHQPTNGGGSSWIAEGHDGCIARVSFPGAALRAKVDPGTPAGTRLLQKLGRRKDELLRPVLNYEPVDGFRERVRALFGPGQSRQIIAACESQPVPRVSIGTNGTTARDSPATGDAV